MAMATITTTVMTMTVSEIIKNYAMTNNDKNYDRTKTGTDESLLDIAACFWVSCVAFVHV
jgi:hypothetical protein